MCATLVAKGNEMSFGYRLSFSSPLPSPSRRTKDMGSPVTNNNFVQEFRSCVGSASSISPGIKKIPARFDKTTGQHVILWKLIVLVFKGAESVMKDDTLVPFMTDDDGFEE